jgi:hypothetical protein
MLTPISACVLAAHLLLQSPDFMICNFLLALTNAVEVHRVMKLITVHCDWEKYFAQLYEYQENFVATEGQNTTLNAAASEGISFLPDLKLNNPRHLEVFHVYQS